MNKIKKLINSILFSFVILGCLLTGVLLNFTSSDNLNYVSADFESYDSVKNNLPDYVKITTSENVGNVDNTIFLFPINEELELTIGSDEIINGERSNWAYIPNAENNQEYYYFDFQSSLSLYYNLTNDQILSGQSGTSLMQSQQIGSYAKKNDNYFIPQNTSLAEPLQLNIIFKIDTNATTTSPISFDENIVTLHREGCYTLAIPLVAHHTENGGITYSYTDTIIYYTFMIFNSNTYFNSTSGLPNLTPSSNIQDSSTSSSIYSRYYFHNYSYGQDINTLPSLKYNPNIYQLQISYTDINETTRTSTIQYSSNKRLFTQVDEKGNDISDENYFVHTKLIDENNVSLYFKDVGIYDISFVYLYKSIVGENEYTYVIPLNRLNNTNFKNKNQRMYVYGYQAVYSDYSNINEISNQPEAVELKSFDFENGSYTLSADITSAYNNYLIETAVADNPTSNATNPKNTASASNPNSPVVYDTEILRNTALDFIKKEDIKPISTNQTPIKFLNNVKNQPYSYIYNLTNGIPTHEDGTIDYQKVEDNKTNFEGFNQNSAGTYLYIIQYKYDFFTTGGSPESDNFHYQLFYFTITNSTPVVTILDGEYNDIYTSGYTNRNVYILNDAENNIYDAKVTILLTARNYNSTLNPYFFRDVNIKDLTNFSMRYHQFEEGDNEVYNQKIAGKYGIMIENSSVYANAEYTVKIYSANSSKPSIKTFTIDTSDIEGISARNVSLASSTTYRVGNSLSSNSTNQPMIFSWNEKTSGASTYGFVKYIPMQSINYYSAQSQQQLSLLLISLIVSHKTLPVSYKIDLNNASTWTEYKNSLDFSSVVNATYVKSTSGFYILEVYDQAGNSSFEIFLLDNTSPIFVLSTSGDRLVRRIMNNNESITVPESIDTTTMTVEWTENKAIYIDNIENYNQIHAYQYGKNVVNAEFNLQQKLESFFEGENNSQIQRFQDLSSIPVGTQPGIDSYDGHYLIIPINPTSYIKSADKDTFTQRTASSYVIPFLNSENGEVLEGTYKIHLRDNSNTLTTPNTDTNYRNYPSGFLTFNVTSDASKMMIKYENNEVLDWASYSLSGTLYNKGDETNPDYTHLPSGTKEDGSTEYYSITNPALTYKFSYYSPIKAKNIINLSFVPIPEKGSKVDTITLKYYPFVKEYKIINGKYYYYYNIKSEATKSIPVYSSSTSSNYLVGQEVNFKIALGSSDFPDAGRYVIERTYLDGNDVDNHDYFKRIMTFIVDDFNLISPPENILDENANSSLESVVGGDIILSLYSGENNSSIEISFPRFNNNGLNIGSFYSQDTFDENENLQSFSIEGNKLPMSLYIPKYKYTVSSQSTVTSNNEKIYSVDYNNNLSYYGNSYIQRNDGGNYDVYVEGVLVNSFTREIDAQNYLNNRLTIKEYEIFAEIIATVKENNKTVTKYYYSNGNSVGGYLSFYEVNAKNDVIQSGTNATPYFYLPGEYVVTIYQANNIGALGKFYDLYKFGFKILSSEPDFEIIGGDGYSLTQTSLPNTFYTNSDFLTIQWQIPRNIYEAEIDEESISIRTYPQSATVSRSETISENGYKTFSIDCSGLVRAVNSYIDITMQYKGFNSTYYNTITKRIYFDISAPSKNLETLMTLTHTSSNNAFTLPYQKINMRKYFDYKRQEIIVDGNTDFNKTNISYSYTIDSGVYKYYSYNVDKNFFHKTLVQTITDSSTYLYDSQFVYYKYIGDTQALKNSYTQVEKSSFASSSYINVAFGIDELKKGYYEIVESDYAGNMVVYIVYLIESDFEENNENSALSYTNTQHKEIINVDEKDITTGFNIYSNSGFKLQSINYKSDPWEVFYIQINGQSPVRYMKSPWLEEHFVYQISFTVTGVEINQVNLTSIFDSVVSSENKHTITLSNRVTGRFESVYLSIMDASLNTTKVEDPLKQSAILNISMPTTEEYNSMISVIYPVKIEIYQYNSASLFKDKWETKMIANHTSFGVWTPIEDYEDNLRFVSFTNLPTGSTLQVKINLGTNARIKYVITDNFGNKTNIIQLANEVAYEEISGNSVIYSLPENDGNVTYLSNQTIRFSFNTLLYTVNIFDKGNNNVTQALQKVDNSTTNISYYVISPTTENNWDDYYRVVLTDSESGEEIKTLHIRIYYKLPYLTNTLNEVPNGGILFNDKNQKPLTNTQNIENQTFYFEGKPYTADLQAITTYSQNVNIFFRNGDALEYKGIYNYQDGYGYGVYLSRDNGLTWENINSTTSATTGYTLSGVGDYLILIKYNNDSIFADLCNFYQVTILDSSSSYYYITVDGVFVSKSDIRYIDRNNNEQITNYIVSVDYQDRKNRVKITENEELGVKIGEPVSMETRGDVYVEIYHYSCSESVGDFTIIYIKETNNFITEFTYTKASQTASLKEAYTPEYIVVSENEVNFEKLTISFSSYYGIEQNKVHIQVLKLFENNFVEIYPTVYENGDLSYIYLNRAGFYRLKLYDSCTPANVQTFRDNEYVEIIFLNSLPITVSYTDETGETVTTEFIQRAVYNSAVTLKFNEIITYYSPSNYPSVVSVTRNGKEYSRQSSSDRVDGYTVSNNTYTFSQPGFYTIKFSAVSKNGIQIRPEEFNFTIINKNESRFGYEFTNYGNYYITKVYKNNIDITEDLLNMSNFDKVIIDNKTYMSQLIINYFDEKTGSGHYKVSINHGDKTYENTVGKEFTFEFWINMAVPPINVSITEGGSTTGRITVRFNAKRLYEAVGDCYLQISNSITYLNADTISNFTSEIETLTIVNNGTYFIQLYTDSGLLLYSYKVSKTEPLNTFAIIAIVISVIVVAAIILITILLRKRQKVK